MKNLSLVGIDLAKNSFQLHGCDKFGKALFRKKISRSKFVDFVANLPKCTIAMEACGGANYFARKFKGFEHEVKIISPQFVKPYVKSNKNDAADAEAICEAAPRPTMRFVPIKNLYAQDIQCLHRVRQRLVKNKTALGNEIRGLLREYGEIIPVGPTHVKSKVPRILEDAKNELTITAREMFQDLYSEFLEIIEKIKEVEVKIKCLTRDDERVERISKIEGIGQLTATAILTALSDPSLFKNGREFSAYLGLVPRQNSTGGKDKLLGISKRGNTYLRTLLITGARATMAWSSKKEDKRSVWIEELKKRKGFNKTCVAVANKNARTIWALLSSGEEYKRAA